ISLQSSSADSNELQRSAPIFTYSRRRTCARCCCEPRASNRYTPDGHQPSAPPDRNIARRIGKRLGKRLQRRIEQVWTAEARAIARELAVDGQQARGQGLVPFRSERRHIAEHADKLIFRNIARQWKRVQPGSAHCGVGKERVHLERILRPPLRKYLILRDGNHQSREPNVLHRDSLLRGSNCECRCQGSAGSESRAHITFHGGTYRNIPEWSGGGVQPHVTPAVRCRAFLAR